MKIFQFYLIFGRPVLQSCKSVNDSKKLSFSWSSQRKSLCIEKLARNDKRCWKFVYIPKVFLKKNINKSVALQPRRAKIGWSGCCQMLVQRALWLAKCLFPTLISVFLTGFRYFSYQVATQLFSRGWVDPVPEPILPEKFLGYSRESNPGLLGWQSDVLTTIPNRR